MTIPNRGAEVSAPQSGLGEVEGRGVREVEVFDSQLALHPLGELEFTE